MPYVKSTGLLEMDIDWGHIKEVWEQGAEDLSVVASKYQVSLPSITLKAQTEGWADRGSAVPLCPDLSTPILTEKEVLLAHKTDLGRLRLLACTVMETLQYETEGAVMLKSLEKLARIYTQVIPLERKTFGLDADTSTVPDGIVINCIPQPEPKLNPNLDTSSAFGKRG